MKSSLLVFTAAVLFAASGRVAPDSAYPPAGVTGDADPLVTQEDIHKTICLDHYTTTVRAVSEATKKMVLKRDGVTAPAEVDHFLSLEIGGSNEPNKNLWAQPYAGKYGARVKDVVETALHRMVCRAEDPMPLAVAQKCITADWVACGQKIGAIK